MVAEHSQDYLDIDEEGNAKVKSNHYTKKAYFQWWGSEFLMTAHPNGDGSNYLIGGTQSLIYVMYENGTIEGLDPSRVRKEL